jgi:hypothetical protein
VLPLELPLVLVVEISLAAFLLLLLVRFELRGDGVAASTVLSAPTTLTFPGSSFIAHPFQVGNRFVSFDVGIGTALNFSQLYTRFPSLP